MNPGMGISLSPFPRPPTLELFKEHIPVDIPQAV
jgi:hypothetical protein